MIKHFPLIGAFFSGFCLMLIEICGTRVMAPYFGTTHVSWTILIGILMLCLSIGNWWGGILADKKPKASLATGILMAQALSMAWVLLSRDWILPTISKLPVNSDLSLVICAVLLFAPTGITAGAFTSFAVRLSIQSQNESGQKSGRTYATSTIGGIIGTFITGFFLLPTLGIKWSIISGMFLLLPFGLLFIKGQWKLAAFIIITSISCLMKSEAKVTQTRYGELKIIKEGPIKYLKINNYISGAKAINNDSLVYDYINFFKEIGDTHKSPREALMIGGSICSIPAYMTTLDNELHFDIIEPDKKLIALAHSSFNLHTSDQLSFYFEDGRTFTQRTTNTYDLIYIDAFTSKTNIPFQLCTQEAIKNYSAILNEDGLLAFNIVCSENKRMFLDIIYSTYKDRFRHVVIYDLMPRNTEELKSWTLVASNSPIPHFEFPEYTPKKGELVFTDDWAPVARLLE